MKIEILDLEFGDYCHATKYSDCNPNDPWRVGFLSRISVWEDGTVWYYVYGDERQYRYNHCRKINEEEGKEILENMGHNKIWAARDDVGE